MNIGRLLFNNNKKVRGIFMGIIQCAEDCKYQEEGYCNLNKCTSVNSINKSCPYFTERLADNSNGITKTPDTDKLN